MAGMIIGKEGRTIKEIVSRNNVKIDKYDHNGNTEFKITGKIEDVKETVRHIENRIDRANKTTENHKGDTHDYRGRSRGRKREPEQTCIYYLRQMQKPKVSILTRYRLSGHVPWKQLE